MKTRRQFLGEVGCGALTAALGFRAAEDLGFAPALAAEDPEPLSFGPLDPLVTLMQETPVDRLLPALMDQLRKGTALKQLVAAGALANARSFGGVDYVGFHTMMALAPCLQMAGELPSELAPLPVFKVLYRNTARLQESGARNALRSVQPGGPPQADGGAALRERVRAKDVDGAEKLFAALARSGPAVAFNHLLTEVQDAAEVHRVNLPARAWELIDVVGAEHAHTLLRQSLRYCLEFEPNAAGGAWTAPRTVLPRMFDQHHLEGKTPGTAPGDDAWVEHLTKTIFESPPEQAADAVASALAEGFSPAVVGEAISLATNQLILRDHGRRATEEQLGKPMGSVHGDSIGVHACDSSYAWRRMALSSGPRNTFACLIVGAWQAAYDRGSRGGDFQKWAPLPMAPNLERVASKDAPALLQDLEAAVRGNLQARASAVVHRYGELGFDPRPVFDVLLRHAISEDGALHAEKYYRTCSEEFAATRPAFRWRQLVALARVTASEYGHPAPGVAEAKRLLNT